MRSSHLLPPFLALALCSPSLTWAQAANSAGKSEQTIERIHHEDKGSRIDELRVRGQTQRITVTPKGGGKLLGNRPYEIIPPAGSQDLQEAPNGVRGAAGKRVWHVLSF